MSSKKIIDREFKINAVRYRKDHMDLTLEEISKNLGVSKSSIHRWCKEYGNPEDTEIINNHDLFRGSGNYSSEDAKELARLKKENRDLRDAVEIIKKAMNILNSQ